jgi:hypothetical protein
MKCDLCNQEFANSEELKRHQEQVHPMGDGKEPDVMENPGTSNGMEHNESEMPDPGSGSTGKSISP